MKDCPKSGIGWGVYGWVEQDSETHCSLKSTDSIADGVNQLLRVRSSRIYSTL